MDNMYYNLLENVHYGLKDPTTTGTTTLCRGNYQYFHYGCDHITDAGWGCGYRTLQTICSWIINAKQLEVKVPSLLEIQETLVDIGDKPVSFIGSRDWIGALEVFYVIDTLYGVSCKIQHILTSDDVKKFANLIRYHFEEFGGPIMMGGDLDSSSKCIAGIHINDNDAYFLIIDPHFTGTATSPDQLIEKEYVQWQHTDEFIDSSFYNLCLPQLALNPK